MIGGLTTDIKVITATVTIIVIINLHPAPTRPRPAAIVTTDRTTVDTRAVEAALTMADLLAEEEVRTADRAAGQIALTEAPAVAVAAADLMAVLAVEMAEVEGQRSTRTAVFNRPVGSA